MNVPKRKGNAPAEATQELQALDVLEIVETLKTSRTTGSGVRKKTLSNSSIAPVGLDLGVPGGKDAADEEINPTMEIRLPMKRRRLGGVVIGAVAGCGLILLAAVIARVGHAGQPDTSSISTATTNTTAATTATTASPTDTAALTATPTLSPTATPVTTATTTANGDSATTGTVRLDRPAMAGRVWLDGRKLSSSSALVSCGTHQVKVGRGRTHSIDVPCGGEIGVSK